MTDPTARPRRYVVTPSVTTSSETSNSFSISGKPVVYDVEYKTLERHVSSRPQYRTFYYTHTTQVVHDMAAMIQLLYHNGQFLGLAFSSSSQSTS